MLAIPITRPFEPHEWTLYRELRLESLREAPESFGSTFAFESDWPDSLWVSRLEDGADVRWNLPLLAEVESKPAGLAWGRIEQAAPDRADLYAMWVRPDVRRLGVGRMLLDAVVDWARNAGASFIELGVARGERPAYNLYSRAGFEPFGQPQPLRPGSSILAQPMRLGLREDTA